MATKKTKKADVTQKVEKTILKVKTSASKANNYALNVTEEAVTETITIASQWQKVTEKALQGGIQLLDN